jgi:hypothetical protein
MADLQSSNTSDPGRPATISSDRTSQDIREALKIQALIFSEDHPRPSRLQPGTRLPPLPQMTNLIPKGRMTPHSFRLTFQTALNPRLSPYECNFQQGGNANTAMGAVRQKWPLTQTVSPSANHIISYPEVSQIDGSYKNRTPTGTMTVTASDKCAGAAKFPGTSYGNSRITVDVATASKLGNEKRRRNAGASARFRQRRKEREREASSVISQLEQRLKAAIEDVEFYKRERDYLAAALKQVPGGDGHFPRPQPPGHCPSPTTASMMTSNRSARYQSGPGRTTMPSPEKGCNIHQSVHMYPSLLPASPTTTPGKPDITGCTNQACAKTAPGSRPAQYQLYSTRSLLPSGIVQGGQ